LLARAPEVVENRVLQNYFNYYTKIEERFAHRKGMIHLLSTLDWALIEVWKDAGIPLEAVLRGIDTAFDHWDKRPERHKVRKVNSLAFCAQEVLAAAQEMASAAVGASTPAKPERETGFESERVASYIAQNADELSKASVPESARNIIAEAVAALHRMAEQVRSGLLSNEEAERHLTVLEEKAYAAVIAATPASDLVQIRAEAERELASYKRKMQSAQIAQLQQQFVHRRLLEHCHIPRFSLFYLY
jgi:hypothetical protein